MVEIKLMQKKLAIYLKAGKSIAQKVEVMRWGLKKSNNLLDKFLGA